METSCAYGRIKYSIFEQGWTILLYGVLGDKSKHYDCEKISAALDEYNQLWSEWRVLKNVHPCCATLYKDLAFQDKAGLGAAVEHYRKICQPVR